MSILSRVQSNPEVGTQDTAYIEDLIESAKRWIAAYVGVPLFPEQRQGYSQSAATPSTDVSAAASNSLLVSVNGGPAYVVEVTLASCTTGDLTAAELQTRIRAIDADGHDEVTVVYNDDTAGSEYYRITSGRYGLSSSVVVSFYEDTKHLARALKLSPSFGGVEYPGGVAVEALDDIVVRLVTRRYRQTGVEGARSGSIDGGGNFTLADIDPEDAAVLRDNYRKLKSRCARL